jgi:hypothetical protein
VASRGSRRAWWKYGAAAGLLAGVAAIAAHRLLAGAPAPELTAPTRLCARGNDREPCRTARAIEELLERTDLVIDGVESTASGKQQAQLLTLVADPGGARLRFRAKWRALSTAHGLNDPRKEVIAYEVQKLVLEPDDFVVPPARSHCFELAAYKQRVDAKAVETFPRTGCIFGTLSYWLEGAETSSQVLDRELFRTDPIYRRTLADTNLLLYLVSNGDTHQDQFVSLRGDTGRRIYCVDFTISLSTYKNPTLSFEEDWSNLHVPLVPSHVERLRQISDERLNALAVVERHERSGNRLLRRPATRNTPPHPRAGLVWTNDELRIGITGEELELLRERLKTLVARVERGEPATSLQPRSAPN